MLENLSSSRDKSRLTEEAVLPVTLPPAALLKFLAEDQQWMRSDLLAVMRLPFPLNPDDPDPGRVDAAWNPAEEAQDDVDPEIDAETLREPNGDGWEEQAQYEAHDLGRRVFAHRDQELKREAAQQYER